MVDSNILVYAYDELDDFKHEIAAELLEKLLNQKINFAFSVQNFSEFYVVMREKVKTKLEEGIGLLTIKDLIELNNTKIVSISPNTILIAISISEKYKVHYFDSLIAATMQENGITTIYTENTKDFSKVPWIKAINPFKDSSAKDRP